MTHVHTLSLIAMLLLQTPGILALAKETSQTTSASHLAEKQRDKVANDRYESLLKESPDDANLHFEYGKTLLKETGSTSGSEGLQHLRKAVKLLPREQRFQQSSVFRIGPTKKIPGSDALQGCSSHSIQRDCTRPNCESGNSKNKRIRVKHLRELPDTAQ